VSAPTDSPPGECLRPVALYASIACEECFEAVLLTAVAVSIVDFAEADNRDIDMPSPIFLGEFEQLVLIAILRLKDDSGVLALKADLDAIAGRSVSRGALYRTLDRLADKGWIDWSVDDEVRPERGGHPRRQLRVTRQGISTLKASRRTLLELWRGIEKELG
jgi:PadR family transcriptional regulator, regulatory protein PadR